MDEADLNPSKKLTKKEKKALAFRANKKGKKASTIDQSAVPDQDDLDEAEDDRKTATEGADGEKKNNKRKRDEIQTESGGVGDETTPEGEEVEPKKKKRQRGKKKSQRAQPGLTADGQPKLVLFIGNLPYKVTIEAIEEHFKPCGEVPEVRLLTPKLKPGASDSAIPKSKGCAFIQFSSSNALQAALRLHESELLGRKINVELTAGGGGNSEQRKQKIEAKRKILTEEREKTAANKKKRAGAPEDKSLRWGQTADELAQVGLVVAAAADDKPKTVKKEILVNGKVKKVRDRRLKKPEEIEAKKRTEKMSRFMTGANAVKVG